MFLKQFPCSASSYHSLTATTVLSMSDYREPPFSYRRRCIQLVLRAAEGPVGASVDQTGSPLPLAEVPALSPEAPDVP